MHTILNMYHMPIGHQGYEMTKRNIVIDDDLWMEIQRETGRITAGTGRPLSASEWIRQTIRRELERLESLRQPTS